MYDETCFKNDPEENFLVTIEIRTYTTGKAQEYVDKINERMEILKEGIEEMIGKSSPCMPKFYSQENTFIVGCKIPVKKGLLAGYLPVTEIPEKFKSKLACNQKVSLEFNAGTTFGELLDEESEEPIANNFNKGLQLRCEIVIMEMFKDILLDQVEKMDESIMENPTKAQALAGITPLLLFTLQGDVKFKFNDLDEIKKHPAMEKLGISTSFPLLLE